VSSQFGGYLHLFASSVTRTTLMASSLEISLRNMLFHVRVGILPHERELSQPLEVDLTVWATAPAVGAIGIDYRDLHAMTVGVLASEPLLLIETIAQELVTGALGIEQVIGARAAVRKPHVALPGLLSHAEVVIEDGVRQ